MKCLTVCQPHAWFMFEDPAVLATFMIERKRIENRCWETSHRGPLLIHAGASKSWMRPFEGKGFPRLTYSAIIGVVELKDCWSCEDSPLPPWILSHQHTDKMSNFWWEIANPRKFETPIKYSGAQRLFNVFDKPVLAAAATLRQA